MIRAKINGKKKQNHYAYDFCIKMKNKNCKKYTN